MLFLRYFPLRFSFLVYPLWFVHTLNSRLEQDATVLCCRTVLLMQIEAEKDEKKNGKENVDSYLFVPQEGVE